MISGLHNPKWLHNILDNFYRQTYKDKKLIIVENGKGNNIANNIYSKDITIIKSDVGVSKYINAALIYIRGCSKCTDWICKTDSDDYYGPEYLSHLNSEIEKTNPDYLGRKSIYVKSTEDHLWLLKHTMYHGPTLAANIVSCIDFPYVNSYGEDALWCNFMETQGKKSLTIEDPSNFCYQRWNPKNHSWPCRDIELRTAWRVPIKDLGVFDIGVVNGKKEPKIEQILDVPPVTPETFLPFRLLKEYQR